MVDDKAKKIVEQIEYYFGDINLPRDKFLQGEVKKEVGWVPLTTMLKFNRLAKLSEDVEEIANALKCSALIEVSENNEKIRRSQDHPLPENTLEYWQEIKRRTVYVKGFSQDASLDEIMQFMNQFGATQNVSLRHTRSIPRVFKGSAFVTYGDKETAEKVVSNFEAKEYKDQPLIVMMQEDYWASKNKQRKEKKGAEKNIKQAKNAQISEEQKQSLAATHFVKGLVLKVTGLPANTEMQKLKDFFKQFGDVGYVTISTEAYIRFNGDEENAAQKTWDKAVAAGADGKVTFNDSELSAQVLDGDDEQKYWDDFHKSKIAKFEREQNAKKKGKQNRKGTGRGTKRSLETAGAAEDAAEKKAKRIVFKDEDEEDDNGNVEVPAADLPEPVGVKTELKTEIPTEAKTENQTEVKKENHAEVKAEVNGENH